MDAVSKRQLVLAIFVVLQSWKLYEWIFDIPNGFELLDSLLAFFFKWATIELLFVSAVHFFRIPKLTFSLPTRMLLFGILMCFNVGLIVVGPLASFWLAPIAKIPSQPASLDVSSILIPLKSGIVDDIAGSKDALLKGNSLTRRMS